MPQDIDVSGLPTASQSVPLGSIAPATPGGYAVGRASMQDVHKNLPTMSLTSIPLKLANASRASIGVAAAGFSREEIAGYAAQMEKEFQKLVLVLAGEASVDENKPSHTRRVIEALVPIGKARTFMDLALAQRDNELIKTVFAPEGDCSLIAHMRTTAEDTKAMLVGTNSEKDERMEHCIDACDRIEAALKNVYRLEEKFQEQLLAAQKEAHERHSQFVRQGSTDLSQVDRIKLLAEIDDGDDPKSATEKLWASFAEETGNHEISGEMFHTVIKMFCEYVSGESKARADRKQVPRLYHPPDSPILLELVRQYMDPNGDKNITKDEFIDGAQKVVDDIDPPADKKEKLLQRLSLKAEAGGENPS